VGSLNGSPQNGPLNSGPLYGIPSRGSPHEGPLKRVHLRVSTQGYLSGGPVYGVASDIPLVGFTWKCSLVGVPSGVTPYVSLLGSPLRGPINLFAHAIQLAVVASGVPNYRTP
jgi:hypothetical protein